MWRVIHAGLSRGAVPERPLNDEGCVSASETTLRNQSIGRRLQSEGRV
jgi:hypothetical protein